MNEILDNIRTEADLCRNETADDIANLLDKAADEIIRLSNLLDIYRKKRSVDGLNGRPWDAQKHLNAENIISNLEDA